MLIYDELKKDHETVKGLLNQLVATDQKDSKTWKALVKQIRDELIPHSRAEEAVLYNSMRGIDAAKELVRHSYSEHMQAETLLRSLQVLEAFDVNSVNTARKLKEALEHHIAEEEGRIFNAAQKLFTQEEALAMGDVFNRMKPEVKKESFMKTTLEMIANMMPERLRGSFRSFHSATESSQETRRAS